MSGDNSVISNVANIVSKDALFQSEQLHEGKWISSCILNPSGNRSKDLEIERFGFGFTKEQAEKNALKAWQMDAAKYTRLFMSGRLHYQE